jgi:hypothetical protein
LWLTTTAIADAELESGPGFAWAVLALCNLIAAASSSPHRGDPRLGTGERRSLVAVRAVRLNA